MAPRWLQDGSKMAPRWSAWLQGVGERLAPEPSWGHLGFQLFFQKKLQKSLVFTTYLKLTRLFTSTRTQRGPWSAWGVAKTSGGHPTYIYSSSKPPGPLNCKQCLGKNDKGNVKTHDFSRNFSYLTSGIESQPNSDHSGFGIIENGQFCVELWYFRVLRYVTMVNHGYPWMTVVNHG